MSDRLSGFIGAALLWAAGISAAALILAFALGMVLGAVLW